MRTLRMDGFGNIGFTFYLTWNQFAKMYVFLYHRRNKVDHPQKTLTTCKEKKDVKFQLLHNVDEDKQKKIRCAASGFK